LLLIFHVQPLKDLVVEELVTQSNTLRILVLPIKLLLNIIVKLLIRSFHSDNERLLMSLRIVMIVEESSPHFGVVALQIRLDPLVADLAEEAGTDNWSAITTTSIEFSRVSHSLFYL
jgi:hypothetical protein